MWWLYWLKTKNKLPGKPHSEEHQNEYEQAETKGLFWDHHIAMA
jgi:hypothetical protein